MSVQSGNFQISSESSPHAAKSREVNLPWMDEGLKSILLGFEHVVRGILGILGLILGPPRWLGGKVKKKILMKKGPCLAELWIWIPCVQLTPCRHICTKQRAELGAVTLANLSSAHHSRGSACVLAGFLDPWL